ncbi:MAG: response regulator transcription factor [Pseudomonadota bacterium]
MGQLKNASILIAEDHTLVRQGFVSLLSSRVRSITEASDGKEALQLLQNEVFDIALLDIGLPELSGLSVLNELRKNDLRTKVILLTGDTITHAPADIYDQGADAFVYKTTETQHLIDVLSDVADGNTPRMETAARKSSAAPCFSELHESLTSREKQVLKMLVEGSTNQVIADKLFISQHTVRKHRENINKKLNMKSPAALARFAISCGLV